MSEKVYEMLWDCPYCGSTKLLGKTHRHCPSCGAPQENAPRYFPPEEEKVAVEDHVFVGADVICPACGTSASQAAKHCGGCGSPLEGGKEVARRADQVNAEGDVVAAETAKDARAELEAQRLGTPQPTAPPKQKSMLGKVLGGVGCLVVVGLVAALVFFLFVKREAGFEVVGHSWQRTIAVERFDAVQESKWCDEMPAGATDVRRSKADRSTKKVQDGEDCKTRKIDQGDGTYKEKKECKPRYKEEAVQDDKCSYKINRWKVARTEKSSGNDTATAPAWPDPKLARTGQCVGCEREGTREEKYTVHLADTKSGEKQECDFEQSKWAGMKDKTRYKGETRVLGGGIVCSSLSPQ